MLDTGLQISRIGKDVQVDFFSLRKLSNINGKQGCRIQLICMNSIEFILARIRKTSPGSDNIPIWYIVTVLTNCRLCL